MTRAERQVASIFAELRRDDASESIDQFVSLCAANQYRKLYELTERHVTPGTEVLDWGCGRGHFSYFLIKRGFSVTAYSLEHPPRIFDALSATERERLTFVHGELADSTRLPFSAGRFSAAFSVGVLEHVREEGGDEAASLRELRRVLADDGVFVCYHLPNRYSYIEAVSRRFGAGEKSRDFHRYRFTSLDIARLCREAGLSLTEEGRYGFLPRNSMNRLPIAVRNSPALTFAVNRTDEWLEWLLPAIVQNHYFVAKRDRQSVSSRSPI
jgi:SAM-dependent methyltransferase